jgi:hypothetical protein
MSLGVEVSRFALRPEIEDRDKVEVGNWAKHKQTFYSEPYTSILFYFQADHKKNIMIILIFVIEYRVARYVEF